MSKDPLGNEDRRIWASPSLLCPSSHSLVILGGGVEALGVVLDTHRC